MPNNWQAWEELAPPVRLAPRPVYGTRIAATATLEAGLEDLSGQLREEQDWRERLAGAVAPVSVPAIGAFTSSQVPYLQAQWGPALGYVWAIQRLTVSGLASSDSLIVYRGQSIADTTGAQNLLQGWIGSLGYAQAWTPGRTGCILGPRQNLIFTGTLSGGPYYANADVIQIESWILPYFLL